LSLRESVQLFNDLFTGQNFPQCCFDTTLA
jgi:hypothetical protein